MPKTVQFSKPTEKPQFFAKCQLKLN